MQFQQHGITVSVDEDEIRRLVLERLAGPPQELYFRTPMPPAIGAEWPAQGGIYAGIARGRDGQRDYHLIVGPEHDGQIDWAGAVEWASQSRHAGFSDFALPFRKEQALCFANVPELFRPVGYWSGEQHASYSDYAWYQDFDYGSQCYWNKNFKFRARLVRRLAIQ